MIRHDVKDIIEEINKNKKHFEEMLANIQNESNLSKQQYMAKKAIDFATNNSTGYYSSDVIENVFLKVAIENAMPNPPSAYKEKTFLHIMTICYETGGHTRVVERWIESAEDSASHSLLITNEDSRATGRLQNAVTSKNGEVLYLNNKLSDSQKGLELRRIASDYEYIILHIHMFDVVPIIAFGNEEFQRPVILFNHADHKFWVGVSIADIVAEFRMWGNSISKNKRGISKNFILGIPLDIKNSTELLNKKECRVKLNLNVNVPIIVSVGAPHKYKPIANIGLLPSLESILEKIPNAEIIIIGANFEELLGWEEVSQKYANRISAMGTQPLEKMFEYLTAADLVIDSFPMSGGTALLDAVSCKKPVLSLESPTGQLDYILNSEAYCSDEKELVAKTVKILSDKEAANVIQTNIWNEMCQYVGKHVWQEKTKKLYSSLSGHRISRFEPITSSDISELDKYLWSENYKVKKVLCIPNIIEIYKSKNYKGRYIFIRILKYLELKI